MEEVLSRGNSIGMADVRREVFRSCLKSARISMHHEEAAAHAGPETLLGAIRRDSFCRKV